jgi:hypothetical protein
VTSLLCCMCTWGHLMFFYDISIIYQRGGGGGYVEVEKLMF